MCREPPEKSNWTLCWTVWVRPLTMAESIDYTCDDPCSGQGLQGGTSSKIPPSGPRTVVTRRQCFCWLVKETICESILRASSLRWLPHITHHFDLVLSISPRAIAVLVCDVEIAQRPRETKRSESCCVNVVCDSMRMHDSVTPLRYYLPAAALRVAHSDAD